MKKKKVYTILLFSLSLMFVSCPRPAEEVAIDFAGRQASQERVRVYAEAQMVREELVRLAPSPEERKARETFANNAEKQILSILSKEERTMYHNEMLRRRLELDNLSNLVSPTNTAFYQDLPIIRGVTIDLPSHFFTLELILAYNANDRRLGTEISSAKLSIVDQLRNLLMQYPSSAFMQGREELLREPIRQNINATLARAGSQGSITHIFITRFEINEIPE
ncbi:hypothetical protein PVA45_01335 [Entomospira entomophila]|uniref:Flagellar protein FliL n=1 Tax=Entomospira entomophila TaxID=2719988 RepID=A0A968G918_9SPIO|nr:hypothetical protein [Entomospira entomophilus]NIZ40162.1 hypothetical protein [Entomospira entomophilus]WDI35720.1 hypothetical protein PVA45_01335 [Entomospira entomophilus]